MGQSQPDKGFLRQVAIKALRQVGDATRGQWEEWSGFAYQIKRRMTPQEEVLARIDALRDIRGTEEENARYDAVQKLYPHIPLPKE